MKPKPNKKELAKMKVLNDMGHTPTAIAKKIGKSHHTVIKYLEDLEAFNDPEVQRLMDVIREKEIDDLYIIGAKARNRLHEILDEGKTKAIETTAILDRTFQQRRLLENQPTEITDNRAVIASLQELKAAAEKRRKELTDHA